MGRMMLRKDSTLEGVNFEYRSEFYIEKCYALHDLICQNAVNPSAIVAGLCSGTSSELNSHVDS